ncbi:AI-2E family transporter [Methanolobus chelungpuianus]|uniref:Permease n=1 Tax=Methanolobus chelungpuianus TaxID=502115 RepID=A0AAE3HB13_9EURY|nr:AI-2E family transporter [Methanolobus chelungpuianus]MCQ6963061.1 permease [Methanolobus chelungpuianus]
MESPYNRILSAMLLLLLAALLVRLLHPYINAFFGALILYVTFRPMYMFLTERANIRPGLAALLVITATILTVMLPLYVLFAIIATELQQMIANAESLEQFIYLLETSSMFIIRLIPHYMPSGASLQESIAGIVAAGGGFLSPMLVSAAQIAGKRLLELIIMYFLLFYLLIGDRSKFAHSLQNSVPFNGDNTRKLLEEFRSVVRTILISTGAIAIIQGALLTVTFLLFGIEGAFLWGFVTMILSFIPALGPPLVWIPAAAFQLLEHDYFAAAGVFFGGIIVSSVDNLIRPAINQKVGRLHPLISVIGVIIGLKLFGLLGIIIGPLLVSYTLLTARMFSEEYMA